MVRNGNDTNDTNAYVEEIELQLQLEPESKQNNNETGYDSYENNDNQIRQFEDGINSNAWIFDSSTGEIKFFKEEKYISNRTRNNNNKNKLKQGCKKFLSSMLRFNIDKLKNFIIWIFLSSDLFIKMLSMLFIILFLNNYNNNNNSGKILNGIFCFVFIFYVLLLEYFCFKFLMIKEKFSLILALKYFVVCTFTISFYFLLFVGLTYLPKMIEKESFVKYQSFKICLSTVYVLIVLLLQLIFGINIIAVQFFILFLVVLLVHVVSFAYLNKVMFSTVAT